MLIDWFTIIAQIINFLILVFLLHRFLYKPIINTIQSRQKEIDRRWQEADEEREAAETEAANYERKQQELEQQHQEIMAQARQKADEEYHHLVEQARREVEQQQAHWSAAIAQQQEQFFETLQHKITEQVYAITRHVLQDLADASLEKQAIATFIHRLETLDPSQRQSLTEALRHTDNGLVIRSGFELSPESRQEIVDFLHKQQIYQGNNLRFATTSALICGIELQASDYKIPWNLQHYLQSLDQYLAEDFPNNERERGRVGESG